MEVKDSPSPLGLEDSLTELALLAETAGVTVVGQEGQRLARIDPATFIGSGKVEEIKTLVQGLGVNVVIFDEELSPRHQRELEKAFGEDVLVLDRSALILDIFAQHAHTREGALQVELAQYEYRLPRLTRQWEHLARQTGGAAGRGGTGGVGLRGPGETQLETDRREIRRRIARLKRELEEVRAHRGRHRAKRAREGIPVIALVGYTNAGKSTLLNALSGAGVYVADQLFATLDPTTRRLTLPGGRLALMTDTVGFIQKLPATLVAAFRATLEEITEADILLHVVDCTHPNARQQAATVEETLSELNVHGRPILVALNKIDLYDGDLEALRRDWAVDYGHVVTISATRQTGLDTLLARIEELLAAGMIAIEAEIPYTRGDLIAQLRASALVDQEDHTNSGVQVRAHVTPAMAAALAPFRTDTDLTDDTPAQE
ncbi:MAG: GTPase HflX [Anaerolineae bacterium]